MNNQHTFCSAEQLKELVSDDPTKLQRLIYMIYPKCAALLEEHFGCTVKLNSFATIEGHLSVYLLIYPELSTKCACISVSSTEREGIEVTLKKVLVTAAQALPLPFPSCSRCDQKHRLENCPLLFPKGDTIPKW